jgi:predicted RNA binding protein YcfA (HicA-like mRNA interferase family)
VPPLPRCSGVECVAALRRLGFEIVRQSGSHVILRRPGGGASVLVPVHGGRDVPAGTLRSILRQAGLTADELRGAL